jgi:transcriptional regulator with XRE-family HTH domain
MSPEIFRTLRTYLGLNQTDLGERLGLSHTMVYLYESGRSPIPANVIQQLVEMLPLEKVQELGFGLGVALSQY